MLILGIHFTYYLVAAICLVIGLVIGFFVGRDDGAADINLVTAHLLEQKTKRDKWDHEYSRLIEILRDLRDGSE
jgi:hypothetical protein